MEKKMKRVGLPVIIAISLLLLCLIAACIVGLLFFWPATAGDSGSSSGLPFDLTEVLSGETAAGETGRQLAATQALGAAPVIHLAGRTDITIPALGQDSDVTIFSCRDGGVIQETFPPGYQITPGAAFTFSATGLTNFYGGTPEEGFPPDGDPSGLEAEIFSFGGISGYRGPAGALLGLFLDDNIPNGEPPDPLDFTASGLGVDFRQLEPQVGQVFFIGDGRASNGQTQTFIAPSNATRLFIGLVDGYSFYGDPTCYADNTGSFDYRLDADQPFEPLP
jgi:hypothetical protein